MKKILLVMTGGTICSFKDSTGHNEADTVKAAPMLIDILRNSDSPVRDAEFDVIRPLNTLSENMSVEKWNILLDSLRETKLTEYAGIIIAHGTDTIHFTAPLIAEVMKGCGIPIGFAASQRPLWDSEANGGSNFINTVEYIALCNSEGCSEEAVSGDGSGVFFIYRNSDGVSYFHRADELEKCKDFSDDFYSRGMKPIDNMMVSCDDRDKDAFRRSTADRNGVSKEQEESYGGNRQIPLYRIERLLDTVLLIEPYVGINYDNYNIERVKHVLHLTYHSGTADSEKLPGFIRKCIDAGVDFNLVPVPEDYRYSSTYQLIEAGAVPIQGKTPGKAYAELIVKDAIKEAN